MVSIPTRHATLVRQYCIFHNLQIKDFLDKVLEKNEELQAFKKRLDNMKFS